MPASRMNCSKGSQDNPKGQLCPSAAQLAYLPAGKTVQPLFVFQSVIPFYDTERQASIGRSPISSQEIQGKLRGGMSYQLWLAGIRAWILFLEYRLKLLPAGQGSPKLLLFQVHFQ